MNDWSEWEKQNAERLAENGKKGWQEWQKRKFPEMFKPENYISGMASNHYCRFGEDFDIAKKLGFNAFRISFEWSRIEPEEGKFSEKEIGHYQEVIRALRARNLEPFVTLWHWTLPLWVKNKGGFKNKKVNYYFSRYVQKIVDEFKNQVRFWITLNEPELYSAHSYLVGIWPPQERNVYSYLKVFMNLARAHRVAYDVIKASDSSSQVGIAKNNIYFEARPETLVNIFLKKRAQWWWNFLFLNKIRLHSDFIGLNYYSRNEINKGFNKNENKIVSDMGKELFPEGIYYVLKDLKKYKKPIYVTENGLADKEDKYRQWFIKETLESVKKAIREGVDVRGYFHWSLIDNFEWDKGFWPRFGLVEIDYQTLERKIRPSAYFYQDIIKNSKT